jgi:hypothetical protein
MNTPEAQLAWHHLAHAQIDLIKADDTIPLTDTERTNLILTSRDHAKQAEAAISKLLAKRPQTTASHETART